MKKVLTALCLSIILAASAAYAVQYTGTNAVGTGVVGSKHDMNKYTGITESQGRVCAYCHTPHHSLAADAGQEATENYLPLWSHKLTTQTSYTPYFTTTVKEDLSNELQGASILCMSCHDGAIAIDQHYGSTNAAPANALLDDGFNGTAVGLKDASGASNLSNDHPIGFRYEDALTNHPGDLNVLSTQFTGLNSKGGPTTKKISDVLQGGVFTCASCHDVHNKDNVSNAAASGANYFLYGTQEASAFCLTCHIK